MREVGGIVTIAVIVFAVAVALGIAAAAVAGGLWIARLILVPGRGKWREWEWVNRIAGWWGRRKAKEREGR